MKMIMKTIKSSIVVGTAISWLTACDNSFDAVKKITPAQKEIFAVLAQDNLQTFNEILDRHNSQENYDYALSKTMDVLLIIHNGTAFVQELLSRKANPTFDISTYKSCTTNCYIFSSYFLRSRFYPEILTLLLKHNTDVNQQDLVTKNTCLMIAA